MIVRFIKYQGTGNDFVILDNRNNDYNYLSTEQIAFICHRRFGIGADGLMMLNNHPNYDFEMKYFNADGKEGSMCGNGGRCLVKCAYHQGIHKDSYRFIAVDGLHEAEIDDKGTVRLKMQDVTKVKELSGGDYELNTGSPHYIKIVNHLDQLNVFQEGRAIRHNEVYSKNGINVNFLETETLDTIKVRTYERGVEDETYSCGTGVTAAALVSHHNEIGFNSVLVHTKGGSLRVEYDRIDANTYTNIWLCGPAERVFQGEIKIS